MRWCMFVRKRLELFPLHFSKGLCMLNKRVLLFHWIWRTRSNTYTTAPHPLHHSLHFSGHVRALICTHLSFISPKMKQFECVQILSCWNILESKTPGFESSMFPSLIEILDFRWHPLGKQINVKGTPHSALEICLTKKAHPSFANTWLRHKKTVVKPYSLSFFV